MDDVGFEVWVFFPFLYQMTESLQELLNCSGLFWLHLQLSDENVQISHPRL